ncbi:MAG: 2,3-bisphosphoglycerate-independent phosphoglycerate mutase [Bacilli bacterium]|nr:2,3-bisphosphoglycerate-independent phosphoglycerate mutase [Bacilli bacterium]
MKPLLLCILDGVGIKENNYGNAVNTANMPNFNMLLNEYPNSLLEASGPQVGLPNNQMGNSEVGHSNIGAGRIVFQPLERIKNSINDKSLFKNKEILSIINHVKENNAKLHIMGLVSDGGIHSHISHLFALIDICKQNEITNLYIHAFTDGRDTLPNVSLKYLEQLQEKLNITKTGKIGTISGRYYSMDRDNRWDRVEKSYLAITQAIGEKANDYKDAISQNYKKGIMDEFIIPTVIDKQSKIENNDGIIVFNFRPDRLRELNMAITNPNFKEFKTKELENIKLLTMMPVSEDVICTNAFEEEHLENTLGEYISRLNLNQLRIAETEKYAHVTYFFDGGEEKKLNNCQRILIPSPKVSTYDKKPEMSANEITDVLLKEIDKNIHDIIILNFANGDMVGHTGDFNATIKALETVDNCLGKIYQKIISKNGMMVVTADHGNSDTMIDENGNIITSHSLAKVPLIITNKNIKLKDGKLADIAPTILYLLNIEKPNEMTGNNLIID